MITNPYKILGVPNGASESECTAAYKKLAKKYHPDLNPNDKTAEEKMAQINAAYDQIKSGKADDASPFSSRQSGSEGSNYYSAVANFINNRQYSQAINLLGRIDDRTPKWYYLASVAYFCDGNKSQAQSYINTACKMAPSNIEYRDAKEKIDNDINPLGYVGFDPFSGGFSSSSSENRGTRTYTVRNNSSCLGRILRFIFLIIIIRFIVYLIMSLGATSYNRVPTTTYGTFPQYSTTSQYDGGSAYSGSSTQEDSSEYDPNTTHNYGRAYENGTYGETTSPKQSENSGDALGNYNYNDNYAAEVR